MIYMYSIFHVPKQQEIKKQIEIPSSEVMEAGTSSFQQTNTAGGMFGSRGLFGVKTELKPGLFASSALKTSSGLFSSGAQVQKGDGIIPTSQASNNTLMVSAIIIYVLACTCRTANFIVIEVKVADILSKTEKTLVKSDTSSLNLRLNKMQFANQARN